MIMNGNNFEPVDEDSANVRRHSALKKLAIISMAATFGTAAFYSNRKSDAQSVYQTASLETPFAFDQGFGKIEDDYCVADGVCTTPSSHKEEAGFCCSKETYHDVSCLGSAARCGPRYCDSTATNPIETCPNGNGGQEKCPTDCIDDAKKVCPCPVSDKYKVCVETGNPCNPDAYRYGPGWGPGRCCEGKKCSFQGPDPICG